MGIFILRHGESTANSGEDDCVDAPLSARGIEQAKALIGRFSLAVVSPLRRARQTWDLSPMQANRWIVDPCCRERVIGSRDALVGEVFHAETDDEFWRRVDRFKTRLSAWEETHDTVLVVAHAYFFAAAFNARGMGNCELREVLR